MADILHTLSEQVSSLPILCIAGLEQKAHFVPSGALYFLPLMRSVLMRRFAQLCECQISTDVQAVREPRRSKPRRTSAP